jgi:vWA-MoxR associated protein C-terminal domain/Effector-associated domain 5
MNFRYLAAVEIEEIVQATVQAGLGTNAVRGTLLAMLNQGFALGLQDVGHPLWQIHADLNAMNVVERLADGSVPLRDWLHQAGSLARQVGRSQAEVFTKYETQVDAHAGGQPLLPDPNTLRGDRQAASLIDLQRLLTSAVQSDDAKMPLARAWFVRSLRHVQTATAGERYAEGLSIADMLSALDDWQQQPRGDLPLLTFAEGLAETLLDAKQRLEVKRLTHSRAREKGLDDAEIEAARKRFLVALQAAPETLQIFLMPKQENLPVDDPQMTFQVSLSVWEREDETGEGGIIYVPCGTVKGLTLQGAKDYINRQLITDFADPSPLSIEFFVPFRLMYYDVDQWPYRVEEDMDPQDAPPLGEKFRVVLRSYDRTLNRALRASSKIRWPLKPTDAVPADVTVQWLEDLRQGEGEIFKALRRGDLAPCLVLGAPVDPNSFTVWQASVRAGVSIGLWCRSSARTPPDVRKQLCQLLTENSSRAAGEPEAYPKTLSLAVLRALPERIYKARQEGQNLYQCLTLFWDDPDRLPPEGWSKSP